MRIVVAGGSGFLGRPLIRRFKAAGHEVTQLVRRPATKPEHLTWDPAAPITLPEDTGAVVNLCGVGVADHRWTADYRRQILASRVTPTATLAAAVAAQKIPVLISASGVGFYGECGDREVTESAGSGNDFLAGVSVQWEGATRVASQAGSRVALLRTGMPLKDDGGFLRPQMLPFRLGVGGKLGSGRQWVPWISFVDWLRALDFVLADERVAGPVNMVGPLPVTNAEFTKALGEMLHRPTVLPIPKIAIQVLYGEFAQEAFRSLRVLPEVLLASGFTFEHQTVRDGLKAALSSR